MVIALGAPGALAQVSGDPTKAEALVAKVCAPCHGVDGVSPAPAFPKLAAQRADYLIKQLQDFKNRRRASDVMAPVVAELSDGDINNLAAYYAAKKAAPEAVREAGLVEAGKRMYAEGNAKTGVPACASCHGADGAGAEGFPRVASQYHDYTVDQLKQFGTGKRKNDKRVMQAIAKDMSEAESKAVAEFLASMP